MSTYNEYYNQARADSISIDDITPHQHNAGLLRQLKENDPDNYSDRSTLDIKVYTPNTVWSQIYYFRSPDDPDAAWLGYFIGKSTVLTTLRLDGRALSDSNNDIRPFCRGGCLNKSIKTIWFNCVRDGQIFGELGPFFRNNHQLSSVTVWDCDWVVEVAQMLARAIACCTTSSLETLAIRTNFGFANESPIGDRQLVEIILALSMQSGLKNLTVENQGMGRNSCLALAILLQNTATGLTELVLTGNSIDDEGVEALASALYGSKLGLLGLERNPSISVRGLQSISELLSDPNTNLEYLDLTSNNIGDDGACVLASGLTNNKKLRKMWLDDNAIAKKGRDTFCKVLCDTSSVEKTFQSNHTLQLMVDYHAQNRDLGYYTKLNRRSDEKMVGEVKILRNHQHFNMQPLFEWDLKVLPLVIVWLEKASNYDTDFEKRIEERKLDAIHQFARAMPMLCIEAIKHKKKRNKRKRQKEKKKQLQKLHQHACTL